MNWVRNNRFLAGFLAVMLLGVGGLGFLLYTALGRYTAVDERYKTQVAELKRLQALPPYPDQANQVKYEEVRKNYAQTVRDLQTSLANYEPAPENPPPTPLQFQDRLRREVEETLAQAQTAGIEMPKERFYLGFEQYSGTPPDVAATPLLSSELNAITDLVKILIQSKHITALSYIKRSPVPGETGLFGATATPVTPAAGKPGAAAPAPLVVKYPIEVAFTALPNSFREVLNAITTAQRLYIVRAVLVKNEMDKGPSRTLATVTDPAAPGAAPAAPAAPLDPNAPPLPDKGPPPLRYVVGQERLNVVLRIELTKVTPPPAAPVR